MDLLRPALFPKRSRVARKTRGHIVAERPSIALESLEPRLLLSASPLSPADDTQPDIATSSVAIVQDVAAPDTAASDLSSTDFAAGPTNVSVSAAAGTAATLSGTAYSWNTHIQLSGIQVKAVGGTTATAATDGSGTYALSGLPADTYALTAMATDTPIGRVITGNSALSALRVAAGINPNPTVTTATGTTQKPLSPYELIAADVNGDGRVTGADALAILRIAAGQATAITPTFKFVAEEQTFYNPVTQSLTIDNRSVPTDFAATQTVNTDGTTNFVAVLSGDVLGKYVPLDGTGTPIANPPTLPTSYFAGLGAPGFVYGVAADNTMSIVSGLANDTGVSATDLVTSDATVTGQVNTSVAITSFKGSVDLTAVSSLQDLTDTLGAGGGFTITAARLAALAGGTLADGAHTLRLVGTDLNGNLARFNLTFTLLTAAPTISALGLSAASGSAADNSTAASSVVLTGMASANATVTVAGQSGLAQGDGRFQVASVKLADGANALTATVTDLAGNTGQAAITITKTGAVTADVSLVWNQLALDAIQATVIYPEDATRVLAIMSLAQFDTLAAIQGTPAYLVGRTVSGPVSIDLALAQAADTVLANLFPSLQGRFDAALAALAATIPDGPAKTAALALGASIGQAVYDIRASDGSNTYVDYTGSTQIGKWRPTGPAYLVAEDAQWGGVTPFALTSGSAFRPAAPPALDSAQYATDLNEIQSLGSATSTTRTADQTQQAQFWADGRGSATPPGHWVQIAEQVALARGNSLADNVRLFASLNVALADSAIAAWDAKYTYGGWRPVDAIHLADQDGNAATTADPAWTSLLIAPAHPDYVSGHSTFSAAAATVLARAFGDATAFSTTSSTLPGVTRSFTSFSQAAAEAGRSRVYAGIHFEFSDAAGAALGRQVGAAALARFSLSTDTQPPSVIVPPTQGTLNTNLVLAGQIIDNISGIDTATYSVDGAKPVALVLDAQGRFSFMTTLALDGSADGPHTIAINATDRVGNASPPLSRAFTLDTRAPAITLASLADNEALTESSRLTGAADPTGSALVMLTLTVDGGKPAPLPFDSTTGAFDQALPIRNLAIGSHTLLLTAMDAAGNTGALSRTVAVQTLAAFTVTKVSPAGGAVDVGTTQRPQVFFSRAVNAATLTAGSLYATGTDGAVLPATIVPADDGSFAWLFFTNPMPGGSTITVHVVASAIRALADGAFLGATDSYSFTTVSLAPVTGTKLVGRVVDPGPDLVPNTFDDIRRGPDGILHTADDVFLLPIANAKIYILGREDQVVYTDAQGFFELDDIPAGTVKVAVDGRTATNTPAGVFFPEMVMSAAIKPGVVNTLMSTVGSDAATTANAGQQEVYLPRIPTSALTAVSDTAPTMVVANVASAPTLSAAQVAALSLMVPPGSAVGPDGKTLKGVTIGIATVPPELVKDMLPAGVLQHTFDITIQAPGVSTFTTPVQITFPNVFGAAPGTKLNVLSFDHTTGLLVINGTATVSADGMAVVSDADGGIKAPGWHGLVPPGWQPFLDALRDASNNKCVIAGIDAANGAYELGKDTLAVSTKTAETVTGAIEGAEIGAEIGALGGPLGVAGGAVVGGIIGGGIAFFAADKALTIDGELTSALVDSATTIAVGKLTNKSQAEIGDELAKGFGQSLDKIIASKVPAVNAVTYSNDLLNLYRHTDDYANALKALKDCLDSAADQASQADQAVQPSTYPQQVLAAVTTALSLTQLSDADQQGLTKLVGSVLKNPAALPTALQRHQSLIADLVTINAFRSIGSLTDAQGAMVIAAVNDLNLNIGSLTASAPPVSVDQAKVFSQLNPLLERVATATAAIPASTGALSDATYYRYDFNGNTIFGKGSTPAELTAVLPPNTAVRVSLFDAKNMAIGKAVFVTGVSGATGAAQHVVLTADTTADTTGDGIPDDAKYIVNAGTTKSDSLVPGIKDIVALQNGLKAGALAPTGIVASALLAGQATAIVIATVPSNPAQQIAYVATGSQGLSVVDVSQATKPVTLAQIALPGTATGIAVDAARSIVAVADGIAGLALVDVFAPAAPKLTQLVAVPGPATAVALQDGIAYVASGRGVTAIDIATGEIRTTLDLKGGTLTALAFGINTLFTLDSNRVLRAITITGDVLIARGSITVSAASSGLTVAGSTVYIGAYSNFAGGFSTVDGSNPDALVLLSGVDANNLGGGAMALNGSGLALAVAPLAGPRGEPVNGLDIVDVSDATDTSKFVTRFTLPATPRDVAIANGIAFVADGTAGLQVVNYLGVDTKGVAPKIAIRLDAADADTAKPGVQVVEGSTIRISPTVSDDVQVRNVELLVNGQVVANDPSYPFDFSVAVPALAKGTTVTIQARATDTGGNATLSTTTTLDVVKDTLPPTVIATSVADGAKLFFVRSLQITFSEPIDPAKLASSGITLATKGPDGTFGTADDITTAITTNLRAGGQILSIIPRAYLAPGDYRLAISPSIIADRAGNALTAPIVFNFTIRPASDIRAVSGTPLAATAPSANQGQVISLPVPFDPATAVATFSIIDVAGAITTRDVTAVQADKLKGVAYFVVPLDANTGDVVVNSLVGSTRTSFADGTFFLQILPTVATVAVQSVSSDGTTATIQLTGTGFIEGDATYAFGATTVADNSVSSGPDVTLTELHTLGDIDAVTLTLPLTDAAFGPVSVTTPGGISAPFAPSLTGIASTALSGTPANAGLASANPGQAVRLIGTGLSTSTPILLHYTDNAGVVRSTVLTPLSAASAGTSATLVIPTNANGITKLQMFGSSTQPTLQIVPLLTGTTATGAAVTFTGAGFVEGAATYTLPGAAIADTSVTTGPDVTYADLNHTYTESAGATVPTIAYGVGARAVTTAGGTSAPLAIGAFSPGLGALTDLSVDAAGFVWVVEYAASGALHKIDPATGAELTAIPLSTLALGSPATISGVGLDVLRAGMTLGGKAVPAGDLLLFDGYPIPNRVVAVDPTTGTVAASLVLPNTISLAAGAFDPVSGHLFVINKRTTATQMTELDPATGATLSSVALPFNASNEAGLVRNPATGTFWYASDRSTDAVEITRTGTVVRTLSLTLRGVPSNNVSGLAFDAAGRLLVASTSGIVTRIDLGADPAAQTLATLTSIQALAQDGAPASAIQASANTGQVITLTGANFGPGTVVLFPTRDAAGATGLAEKDPLSISADGTKLQVIVPDTARTGDIRVVNTGTAALGIGSADAVYRQITRSFTPAGATTTIAFADLGLQGIASQSWGIDNVRVMQNGITRFQDDFEGAAKPNWADPTTDASLPGTFSKFSGRFSSATQTLSLAGLTPGQTVTLSFDLYVLGSWYGSSTSAGPSAFQVVADGTTLLSDTFQNATPPGGTTQSFGASAPLRLQIVPTLTYAGQPGTDTAFTLSGSGFQDGASTITVGGVAVTDAFPGTPLTVSGTRNGTYTIDAPLTLDGPIKITTEGGSATLVDSFRPQRIPSLITIQATADLGMPADTAKPSANVGQSIVLTGQGFYSTTPVQFAGIDDTGAVGTITRTGTPGANGTTLTVVVPALARTGAVTVFGNAASLPLQIVPVLRGVGGTVSPGAQVLLDGTGLVGTELTVLVDGRAAGTFAVRTVADVSSTPASQQGQQLLSLTLPPGTGPGVITVLTAGGSATVHAGIASTATTLAPATDVGDTLATALPIDLPDGGRVTINGRTDDGMAAAGLDVDLYKLVLAAGDQLTARIDGFLDNNFFGNNFFGPTIRLFTAAGVELSPQLFVIPAAGTYYLGISGAGNASYNPAVAGSGTPSIPSIFSINYTLTIERLAIGDSRLSAITSTAATGTPARAAVASANPGQTITIAGTGLLTGETLQFSAVDSAGAHSWSFVSAASVATDGTSLTVVVPADATTGTVRLLRDSAGLLLQIVPTLTHVDALPGQAFTGSTLTLTGAGFAEGATTVLFGTTPLADTTRQDGIDVTRKSVPNDTATLTVPQGVVPGPIRVATVGGTSAAAGPAFAGLTAIATSGTPTTSTASANPGQAITLFGTGFDIATDVVFQVLGVGGTLKQTMVRPSSVSADGTKIVVIVPPTAITGVVRVVADQNATAVALQIVRS